MLRELQRRESQEETGKGVLKPLDTEAEVQVASALIWWEYWLVSGTGAAVSLLSEDSARIPLSLPGCSLGSQ